MTNDTEVHWLQSALTESGYEVDPYSGRSMMGKKCLSVTINSESELLEIGRSIGEWQAKYQDFSKLPTLRTDNMGRSIVAYWPSAHWTATDNETA